MSVPFYPFNFLPFKLPNKGIDFPSPPLKLPNKGMEEYSKMILFIPFHSIPFPPPKRGLSKPRKTQSPCTHEHMFPLLWYKSKSSIDNRYLILYIKAEAFPAIKEVSTLRKKAI